jgi:hypothetical protein
MAQYENLPVFKATYDLLLDLYKTLNNVPRDLRYTLVQDLKNELTQLMVLIYKANSQREKPATLRKCLDLFLSVRLRIRLLKDMHFLSVARFAELSLKTEIISKQLTGWHNHSVKLATKEGHSTTI